MLTGPRIGLDCANSFADADVVSEREGSSQPWVDQQRCQSSAPTIHVASFALL